MTVGLWVWFFMVVSVISLGVAWIFARGVLAADTGTKAMQEIAGAIKEGAEAFLKRQYTTIYGLSIVLGILIFAFYTATKGSHLAWETVTSFFAGAICSGLAGFSGMFVSIRANLRAASAARTSLNRALQLALRGGAVTGLSVVALSLLGVGIIFLSFGGLQNPKSVPYEIVGFGFGASFVALFAQLGGGIYTKAADVGADLVGKVEAGIPEDDPRNPAVIADLVGDNVGDCAGRGADLFESTAAENIGAMILGVALFGKFGVLGIFFPLVARAFGLIASIIGIWTVRLKNEDEDPMAALNRGYMITSILAMIGFYVAVRYLLSGHISGSFAAGVIGIVNSYVFVWITQYYTEYRYRPCCRLSRPRSPAPRRTSSPACRSAWNARRRLCWPFPPRFSARITAACTPFPVCPAPDSTAPRSPRWACSPPPLTFSRWTPSAPSRDNAGGIIEMSGAAGRSPQAHRPARFGRQHDEGAHQGLRNRLGGSGSVSALLRLSRRDHRTRAEKDGQHGLPLRTRGYQQGARVHRRADRRRARLSLQRVRHQGRRKGRVLRD